MNDFETMWRNKVKDNIGKENNEMKKRLQDNNLTDPVIYSKKLIKDMRETMIEDRIKILFTDCACHMPKEKLQKAKEEYEQTVSLKAAHEVMQIQFEQDIKSYKQLSEDDLKGIVSKGWGAAGVFNEDHIIATKIPSRFHEYFKEEDPMKKAFYYCHCPRVRKELLTDNDLDSIYCNCGGGFYKNIWETITSHPVSITVLKNLFDGDKVCQFKIEIQDSN